MTGAITHVVLLLAVSADPSSEVVSRAAVDSLAAPFTQPPRVVLREVPQSPSPPQIAALALEAKADSVVILTCAGRGCAEADVRVAGPGAEALARTVRFGAHDELGERGRAIGLLASTLLPDGWSRTARAPAVPEPSPPAASAVTAIASAGEASATTAPLRWGVETVAGLFAGSSGVSDLGLTLAIRRAVAGQWAARAALKLELGDLPGGGGTVRALGGGLGVGWTSAGLERPGHFGVGARADFIGVYRESRLSMTTETERFGSVALGADAMGLCGYALSPGAAVVAGAGAEALFTVSRSTDDDAALQRTTPSNVRFVAELGILARF